MALKYERSDYTGEDIAKRIAPLFGVKQEDILHDVIIIFTSDGMHHIIGCEHAEQLLFTAQFQMD